MKAITVIHVFTLILCGVLTQAKINVEELKCLVCKASVDELDNLVNAIDPTKRVDVGGYRLDSDGNYQRKTVSQAKSEIHLSEVLEQLCSKMDDYVRATWKSTGKLTLLKLMTEKGLNPAMSEMDIIQDDDLNKSLKYYCEGIVEEFEENIIKHIQEDTPNLHVKVCVEETSLCVDTVPNLNEEL